MRTVNEGQLKLKQTEVNLEVLKGNLDQQIMTTEALLRSLRASRAEIPPKLAAIRRKRIDMKSGVDVDVDEFIGSIAPAQAPSSRVGKKPWEP